MVNFKKSLIYFVIITVCYLLITNIVYAATPQELLRAIEDKSKALSEINSQIQEAQKNLTATEQKGKTLTQEIKKIDYRVSQLNLSIKSSELKIEKLGLEIENLGYDIQGKEQEIGGKKDAITNFLRALQEQDRESTLLIFLKNRSLAQGLFEAQAINQLSDSLSTEMIKLQAIKNDLNDKLDQTADKKNLVEAESLNLQNKKSITEDQKNERQDLLKATKNQEKLYQQQLKDLEKLQSDIASEIEAIERELRKQIDPNLLPIPRPGVLAWPTAAGVLSQGYGQTNFALRNYRGQYHNGVDIAAPIGTEIYAAQDGEVIAVGNQDLFCRRAAYGKFIVVKHENGLTTLYGHLSRQVVSVGQKVERGNLIGYMGKTGWATGSHLHFTVWSTVTYIMRSSRVCGPMPVGGDLDPMQYLERPPTA